MVVRCSDPIARRGDDLLALRVRQRLQFNDERPVENWVEERGMNHGLHCLSVAADNDRHEFGLAQPFSAPPSARAIVRIIALRCVIESPRSP
jgi:hypothetical protein